jgi:hypothetical protein
MHRLWTFPALALVTAVAPLGCNRYERRLPETGATLEGAVTYGGQPLPIAMVVAVGEKWQATGRAENGHYKIENAPLGEVKIGVNTDAIKGQLIGQQIAASYKGPEAKGGSRPAPPKLVEVPAKYAEPENSGVTAIIKRGKNSFDISLAK